MYKTLLKFKAFISKVQFTIAIEKNLRFRF